MSFELFAILVIVALQLSERITYMPRPIWDDEEEID